MKMKFPAVFAALVLLFSSCQKDLSEERGTAPDPITAGAGTGSTTSNCKDCLYYPDCSGSVYTFSDTLMGAPGGSTTTTYTFVKDTVIDGKSYQKIAAGSQNVYMNCTAGVSTSIIYNGTTIGGSTLAYTKVTPLKANEPVGTVWVDIINNAAGQPTTDTYTIMEKGISRTVSGHTYPDVIHVHSQTTIDPGTGPINAGKSEYYFAKGVGLIESSNFDDFSGTEYLHHVLVSAVIP